MERPAWPRPYIIRVERNFAEDAGEDVSLGMFARGERIFITCRIFLRILRCCYVNECMQSEDGSRIPRQLAGSPTGGDLTALI